MPFKPDVDSIDVMTPAPTFKGVVIWKTQKFIFLFLFIGIIVIELYILNYYRFLF